MQKRVSCAESLKKDFFSKIVAQIANATDAELHAFIKKGNAEPDDKAKVMLVLAADELKRRESWMTGIW